MGQGAIWPSVFGGCLYELRRGLPACSFEAGQAGSLGDDSQLRPTEAGVNLLAAPDKQKNWFGPTRQNH
jgi:hypothetical protein